MQKPAVIQTNWALNFVVVFNSGLLLECDADVNAWLLLTIPANRYAYFCIHATVMS